MKGCPHCQTAPMWNFARRTSARENADRFILSGCSHGSPPFAHFGAIVAAEDRMRIEQLWNAHAEATFTAYTARWTEAQRKTYRARLWPEPTAPTELFNRNREEEPTYNHGYAPEDDPFAQP